MNSTRSYQPSKQRLIDEHWGAEECIKMLEHAILDRPAAAHPIKTITIGEKEFKVYQKISTPTIYGILVFPEGKVTVTYAVEKKTKEVYFMKIT